jgi:hypothetical protein
MTGMRRNAAHLIMSVTASVLLRPSGAVWCRPVQVKSLSEGRSYRPVLFRTVLFGSTAGSTSCSWRDCPPVTALY